MQVLLIALTAGVGFVVAYHTYGKWLGRKIFNLSASAVCPSVSLEDGQDFVPTRKSVVFGHHFTSIAGTGPIVGPAIAVMWGWLPALLWVVFGSIFIGAVHDFGALVVSLRNQGQTVGEISGRVINTRVRLLFLLVLFLALTIVLAIFGLVIAAVFKQYPAAIFPCLVQIPLAIGIGLWLHRKGANLLLPSILALSLMYLSVVFGDVWLIGTFNTWAAGMPIMVWVIVLLAYCYVASILPVWMLLQPRDFINALQLISALGLIVVGLAFAAFFGGAPPVEGAARQPLEMVAPMVRWEPADAPMIFPFLFITIACGAVSGFHCLVSSGTSSKQLKNEKDAQFVGFGSMLTEGFLATLVILACCAGLGLGVPGYSVVPNSPDPIVYFSSSFHGGNLGRVSKVPDDEVVTYGQSIDRVEFTHTESTGFDEGSRSFTTEVSAMVHQGTAIGGAAYNTRYASWTSAGALGSKVAAFVDGSANFLKAMGIPAGIAIALMGVLVASFAGTTLDTACRLQRYVVQELARCLLRPTDAIRGLHVCEACGYDLRGNLSGECPECGAKAADGIGGPGGEGKVPGGPQGEPRMASAALGGAGGPPMASAALWNPLTWLANKHGATLFAVVVGGLMAAMPAPGNAWTWANAGKGGLILWPMFGATNQLLGGLAFMVITFYLWRRGKAIWFVALPLVFMIVMPAWAMVWLIFIADGSKAGWAFQDSPNWVLIGIAAATLVLEAWMLVEAAILFPKARGLVEGDGDDGGELEC